MQKGNESQVNALVYIMGPTTDDIFASFGLNEEDSNSEGHIGGALHQETKCHVREGQIQPSYTGGGRSREIY